MAKTLLSLFLMQSLIIIKNLRQKLIFTVSIVGRKIISYKYFLLFTTFAIFIGIIFLKKIFIVEEISQQDEVKQVIPVEVVKAEYSLGINNKLTTNGKTKKN